MIFGNQTFAMIDDSKNKAVAKKANASLYDPDGKKRIIILYKDHYAKDADIEDLKYKDTKIKKKFQLIQA